MTEQFENAERVRLLAVKGVGPTVIQRLEEFGIARLSQLAKHDPLELCAAISASLGSTCWRNSSQARAAMIGAVAAAVEAKHPQSTVRKGPAVSP